MLTVKRAVNINEVVIEFENSGLYWGFLYKQNVLPVISFVNNHFLSE